MKKRYKLDFRVLIIIICIILQGVVLISAGTTTLNQNMNLKIGDCWNQKTITQIEGLKITWEKGCKKVQETKLEETSINVPETDKSPETIQSFCNLIEGNGNHAIIVYGNNLFSDEYMLDWGKWVYDDIQTRTPYNEFTYSLYYEKNQGDCGFNSYSDIEMGIMDLGSYYGMSWFNGQDTNRVWFDDNLDEREHSEKWDFLLMHEIGHIFTKADHSNDGSIMDKNGGNGEYNEQEINTIRNNLNG